MPARNAATLFSVCLVLFSAISSPRLIDASSVSPVSQQSRAAPRLPSIWRKLARGVCHAPLLHARLLLVPLQGGPALAGGQTPPAGCDRAGDGAVHRRAQEPRADDRRTER